MTKQETSPALVKSFGVVEVITLNRPSALNALNAPLVRSLMDALLGSTARVIVMTGAGRAFCSGQDLTEAVQAEDYGCHLRDRYNPLVRTVFAGRTPVVAAVNGLATGAGLALALAAPWRVMAASATLAGGFLGVALAPDCGLSFTLPRLVGPARALSILGASEPLSAQKAMEMGLVDAVLPDEGFLDAAVRYAQQVAAVPKNAWAATRRLIEPDAVAALDAALEREAVEQKALGASSEHLERLRLFLERPRR